MRILLKVINKISINEKSFFFERKFFSDEKICFFERREQKRNLPFQFEQKRDDSSDLHWDVRFVSVQAHQKSHTFLIVNDNNVGRVLENIVQSSELESNWDQVDRHDVDWTSLISVCFITSFVIQANRKRKLSELSFLSS